MSSDAHRHESHEDRDEELNGQPPLKPITPPDDLRTDPQRGTGELGTEGLDPSDPLP